MNIAAHRFNNNLRYREGSHDRQRQLTPLYVLVPVLESLGTIDLDPCTEPDNPTGAAEFFTADDDGLVQEWGPHNTIYCNPPYGKAREPWTEKCIQSAELGAKVVLLIPAHMDTRLVQRCMETAQSVVFIKGRVKFGIPRANGRQEAASHPSALFGWNVDLTPCRTLGFVVSLPADAGLLNTRHGES